MKKISHKAVVVCSNNNHTATYEIIESYDTNCYDIAKEMFFDDFGEYPKRMKLESYEAV